MVTLTKAGAQALKPSSNEPLEPVHARKHQSLVDNAVTLLRDQLTKASEKDPHLSGVLLSVDSEAPEQKQPIIYLVYPTQKHEASTKALEIFKKCGGFHIAGNLSLDDVEKIRENEGINPSNTYFTYLSAHRE